MYVVVFYITFFSARKHFGLLGKSPFREVPPLSLREAPRLIYDVQTKGEMITQRSLVIEVQLLPRSF